MFRGKLIIMAACLLLFGCSNGHSYKTLWGLFNQNRCEVKSTFFIENVNSYTNEVLVWWNWKSLHGGYTAYSYLKAIFYRAKRRIGGDSFNWNRQAGILHTFHCDKKFDGVTIKSVVLCRCGKIHVKYSCWGNVPVPQF